MPKKIDAIMSQVNYQIQIKRREKRKAKEREKRKAKERNQKIKISQSKKDFPAEIASAEIPRSFMNFISFNFGLR